MFGVGFGELVLIFIVGLIVLGPKQLTQVAIQTTHFIKFVKKYFKKLKQELYEESGTNHLINTKNQLVETTNSIKSNLKNTDNDS